MGRARRVLGEVGAAVAPPGIERDYLGRVRVGRDAHLERAAPCCSPCGRPLTIVTARGDPALCRGCLDDATAERRRRIKELSARQSR